MTYCGSKKRLAKYIVPILQKEINTGQQKGFIDLCCGGCNITEQIDAEKIIAIDKNKYVIALFKHLCSGGTIPEHCDRETFNDCKANKDKYEDYLVGAYSILGSFAGKGFSGGYAPSSNERHYYEERFRSLMKQISRLKWKNIEFIVDDLFNLDVEGYVIYVDPPYEGTQYYDAEYRINHNDFWEKMRELSKKNTVFISELKAPEDFEVVWSQDLLYTIAKNTKKVNECLFKYKE